MSVSGWSLDPSLSRQEIHSDGRVVRARIDRPRSFIQLLIDAVASNPDGEALVDGDRRLDWSTLYHQVELTAAGLLAMGVAPGDRVVLFMSNRAEYVIALFGIVRTGAIAVPVGIREQAPGLAYIARQSGARVILLDDDLLHLAPAGLTVKAFPTKAPFGLLKGDAINLPVYDLSEDSPACIMYTSGTTGRPKGAVISHFNLVHVAMIYADCARLVETDRLLAVVPLTHITGLTALIAAAARSTSCLVLQRQFNVADFLEAMATERISFTMMVPAMYNLVLARADLSCYDLSRWRVGCYGGAPMPTPTINWLREHFPRLELMNCYGATETVGPAVIMPSRYSVSRSDAVGMPVPGVEILAMDNAGRSVPPGDAGELWIAGPTVVSGYWNDPNATALGFSGGYWRSGDLGSIDTDGFVKIHDRIKDMINRGGYKIYTAEVESVLMSHPAVLEAAVLPRSCPVLGERVHAIIVRNDAHADIDEQKLSEYCATRLADYKVPETFDIRDDLLPRNLNGKVMKRDLRLV